MEATTKQGAINAQEHRADELASWLRSWATADKEKILRFAVLWTDGQRSPTRLAEYSGLSMPTARTYKARILQETPKSGQTLTKEALSKTLTKGIHETSRQGEWQSTKGLAETLAKLEGYNEPDRSVSEVYSIQAVIGQGGLPALDAQIAHLTQRLASQGLSLPSPSSDGQSADSQLLDSHDRGVPSTQAGVGKDENRPFDISVPKLGDGE